MDNRYTIPKRNWKRYGFAYIAHGLQGLACGYLLKRKPRISLVGTGLYFGYQTLEFLRRRDTPGRDTQDFGIGWGIGVIACELLDWLQEDSK